MQTTDPTGIFNRNKLSEEFSNVLPDEARLKLDAILLEIQTDFPEICYSLEYLNTKFRSFSHRRVPAGRSLKVCFRPQQNLPPQKLRNGSLLLQDYYIFNSVFT